MRQASALAAGALVLLSGMLTREVGGGRAAQILTCAVIALAPVVTGAGHLLSAISFYLPVSALLRLAAWKVPAAGRWNLATRSH